jgi:hypothetical protein
LSVIDSDEPEPPAWLLPDRPDTDTGGERSGSRQTLLLVGGGAVVLALVAGVAAFGLFSGSDDTARPRPRSAAADPVVLVPSTDPATAGPEATASPAGPPQQSTPAPARTSVAAAQSSGPRVTAASISVEPAGVTGPCPRAARYVRVTMKVTVTVSVPDVRLRYTVDGGKELGATMRQRTFTDTWEATFKREAGRHTSTLRVTAPTAASDTATFQYTCD